MELRVIIELVGIDFQCIDGDPQRAEALSADNARGILRVSNGLV